MTAQQLKNSILQMAVQGKLVEQNPDDEPASVLLERIKAEKQELIKTGKIKKGKPLPEITEDEIPFDIPDSWEWVRLGIISTYNQTKQKIKAKDADVSIWGLDLEDIEKGGKLLEKKTVGERKAIGDKTVFNKGDILYSKLRPYLLKILVAPDSGICTPEIVPFTVYGGISAEYIVNFLKSPYVDGLVNGETYGIKMPRAGTETMVSLLVPLPPINEQHRIVAKIEELLPYIEKYGKAEEQLTALNTTFPEALKKSILQEAVQGKLVPQNPDDEPASVLLERIRAEKQALIKTGKIKKEKPLPEITEDEIPFDIPDSWEWCRLGNILLKLTDGTHSTPKYTESGIPFISVKDVSSGNLDFSNCKHISEKEHFELYERCNPEYGDILLTKVGTTGIPVIVDTTEQFSLFVSVALLKFNQELLYNKYLIHMINSPLVQKQATENTKGVGNKNWVMRDIANTLIVIPPIEEQHRIVAKIEELMPIISTISK